MKWKIIAGVAALALLIAGASFAYEALRDTIKPEVVLEERSVSTPVAESQAETAKPDAERTPEPEEEKAPDFTVEDADGNPVQLSDFEGMPVVLNFWASWCPPCKAEMPGFDAVYAQMGGEVTFMMVNLTDGQRETREKGEAYVAEQGFSFPVYYDTTQEAAYAYGIRSIPTTLFIDSQGNIVAGAEGQLDEEALRYGIGLIWAQEAAREKGAAGYYKISAQEAHDTMEQLEDYILLDVRTSEEYQQGHIPGAVLIPDYEISDRAQAELPEKDALILVYCRSGRRSAEAAAALAAMGYVNVYDFGGILDWPYETR